MIDTLTFVLKVTIAVLIFACGLLCRLEDVAWLWRRPALLLRSGRASPSGWATR